MEGSTIKHRKIVKNHRSENGPDQQNKYISTSVTVILLGVLRHAPGRMSTDPAVRRMRSRTSSKDWSPYKMAFNEILAKTWCFQTLEPEVDWWLYSLSWCWNLHLGGKVQVDGWCQSQGSRVPGVWVSVKRLEALLLSGNLSGYESKLEFETTLFIILYRMLNRKESTHLYIQLRLSHFSLGRASMAITVTNCYTTNGYIWDARLALPFGPWYHPGLNKQRCGPVLRCHPAGLIYKWNII